MASPQPASHGVLVVCAHPDDESFGLGGVLRAVADAGSRLGVLCFTHREASTLHGVDGDLAVIRAEELDAASRRLGVERVELLDYPDGSLAAQAASELAGHVRRVVHEIVKQRCDQRRRPLAGRVDDLGLRRSRGSPHSSATTWRSTCSSGSPGGPYLPWRQFGGQS